MNRRLDDLVLGHVCDVGWGQVVDSMRGAIDDRSHAVSLGILVGLIVIAYGNYCLLKLVLSKRDQRSGACAGVQDRD